MMSSRPSPLWPYLLVLIGLFALTIAIPTWRTGTPSSRSVERPSLEQHSRDIVDQRNLASVMVVRPVPASTPTTQSEISADSLPAESQQAGTTQSGRTTLSGFLHGPLVEAVAQKIADLRRFTGRQPGVAKPNPPTDRVIDFPITNVSASPFPLAGSLLGDSSGSTTFDTPIGEIPNIVRPQSIWSDKARIDEHRTAVDWPLPSALLTQLDRLAQFSTCVSWADKTEVLCRDLCQLTSSDARQTAELIRQLQIQADLAETLAHEQSTPQAATEVRRSRYALQRRLALWQPTAATVGGAGVFANVVSDDGQRQTVDVRDLLASIERYERTGLVSDARIVAATQEQLRYSNLQEERNLAAQIDEHYRNANVRMAFTGELLSRLLPNQPPISGIVNDRIRGTPVRGVSDTTTRLEVRLIPDPRRIHLWLEAHGTVDSRTAASRGPVTLNDRGESAYIVHKAVIIDERGLGIAKAMAEADSNTQLVGISTRFDGRPLVSAVVRDRAVAKYDKQHAEALREVDQKVANQAARRVDADAKQALEDIETLIVQQMLSPLEKMGVDAQPISFGTTTERVTMRLRLAGENQLGGHTARPQAPSDSLASMQVHESALNNVLDQLELAGNSFTLPDLFMHLAKRTSKPITVPSDLPDDVSITFANRDPVHVRCQDGAIRVTLAVETLRQGSRTWRDFSISATYAPEIDHLHARLVRSGPIELGGENYKGRAELALRTIFSKVLPRDRKLDLVPSLITDNPRLSGLSLTQCVIDDGWIGIAIGQDRTAMREKAVGEEIVN